MHKLRIFVKKIFYVTSQRERNINIKTYIMQEEKEKLSVNLPDNAFRELKEGEKYQPILRPDREYPEVTPYSVSMGLIMAVIFSAAALILD